MTRSHAPVLVLTAGGSMAPLRTAIRKQQPGFVRFVASEAGEHPSSAPEARALAEELGLPDHGFDVVTVPPDDVEVAGTLCEGYVEELRRRFPGATLTLDYTGGTKSMSAALMLAGIREPEARVELQIMAGTRDDLLKVKDGTEQRKGVVVDALLALRTLQAAERAWRNFGYAEAELLLAGPVANLENAEAVPAELRDRLVRAHRLSALFAAWDRFDHAGAHERAGDLAGEAALAPYRDPLLGLARLAGRREPSALLVLDLWNNACRRAGRGRHEDAVARAYRAAEAAAQWLLREAAGIDTGAVDLGKVPEEGGLRDRLDRGPKGRNGKAELTLIRAWELIEDWGRLASAPEPLRAARGVLERKFMDLGHRPPLKALKSWTEVRNDSILGHGFTPVDGARWDAVETWVTTVLIKGLLPRLGVDPAARLPQLPTGLRPAAASQPDGR